MTEEGQIALKHEEESPVFPNKMLVDKSYNETMLFAVRNLPPRSHFTIGSHNETTIELALGAVTEMQKKLEDTKCQVSFAQLKGLGDKLTYNLSLIHI